MPRLKAVEIPREFLVLNDELAELKKVYDEKRLNYRIAVEALAAEGYKAGHLYKISPLPYPTLRKWMEDL